MDQGLGWNNKWKYWFWCFTVEDVIINLLVDDVVKARSHRSNLFNTKIKYFGVGISFHKEYDICTVINYIGEILNILIIMLKNNNDFKLNKNNMKIGKEL